MGFTNREQTVVVVDQTELLTKITSVDAKMKDAERVSNVLKHGVQVIESETNSPLDFEIQGRTLVSHGNSNLNRGGRYVLADKKTKVKDVDGTLYAGITKFTKSDSLVTKADFVGKVSGSTVENPHVAKQSDSGTVTTLLAPSSFSVEMVGNLARVSSLDGNVGSVISTGNGSIAQTLFSFNVIEQIERKMGRIPKSTLAEKVQWVKDNVNAITASWYGYGSSVGGNKASVKVWDGSNWVGSKTNTSSTPTLISVPFSPFSTFLMTDGYCHILSYAEPSDGVTASTINTDYISLDVELKSTAQLDTRPSIIRVANFEGKVNGSVVENPHSAKGYWNFTTLTTPTNTSWLEASNTDYGTKLKSVDNSLFAISTSDSTEIAQQLFSFDLIAEVERKIGRIPKTSVADKVQWLKDNVSKLTGNWWGYGSSVGGNKATVSIWDGINDNKWEGISSHSNNSVTKITYTTNNANGLNQYIQVDGFIHYLAYAEPSDGTTASTINTDYVELEIELKPNASFVAPKVPLYEIPQVEYDKVLVEWTESDVLNRYPVVEGIQHLNSPAVIAEGENLLPPFHEWTLHANAKVISPYELELNATSGGHYSDIVINAIEEQAYNISFEIITGQYIVAPLDVNNSSLGALVYLSNSTKTFTTPKGTKKLKISVGSGNLSSGNYVFKNPMLTLGSTPKPFVPRNPSYLFADVKLGQLGDKKDVLYKSDGNWYVRKSVEKDVVLDGSYTFGFGSDFTGFKNCYHDLTIDGLVNTEKVIKYNGKLLNSGMRGTTFTSNDQSGFAGHLSSSKNRISITISDTDSGWGETYTPTSDDIKRYFNGWKYVDGTTWNSVTGNGQTADAATALSTKPTDYTPYKLSYVLATPQIVNVTDKVEGSIAVSGKTQVEVTSGVVVREKVVPQPTSSGATYEINEKGIFSSVDSPLKYKTNKILAVYKNGELDIGWKILSLTTNQNGSAYAEMSKELFDPTATYTVTYLVLDRHQFTVNGTDVKTIRDASLKNVVDTLVARNADQETQISVNHKAILDLYIRMKALGG